jgi:phospholipid/cholesterol/gamma-HCH transport system substrate-binding protein
VTTLARRLRHSLRLLLGLLLGSLVLSACDFDVYSLPLPGGTDVGDDPITVKVEFADVLDLVPKSTVKVNDVSVGMVKSIELDDYRAEVTVELRKDTKLPDDAIAEIRQTSLLGEKFVSLSAPEGSTGAGELGDGDVIPIERTGRNPEVEEVLGALSLVLNGGGVAQLKTIAQELNQVMTGREDNIRSVLAQIDTFTGSLDTNKAAIVDALEALNRLAVSAHQQEGNIDEALEELPSALTSIDGQRQDLVRMLQSLNQLSDVGVRVIKASKEATIDSLEQLQPVLNQLAASGDNFVKAFHVFLTYPFVDDVVGRDPQVARNLHMGDYTNLSVTLDLDFSQGLPTGPGLPTDLACTHLSDIPDAGPLPPFSQLCADAIAAINKCLQSTNPLADCQDLPDIVLKKLICPNRPIPGLCPGAGGAGNNNGGTPTLPVPSVSIPGLPTIPGVGGVGGTLGGLGRSATGPWNDAAHGGPTMAQLQEVFDPSLVNLLVPQLVLASDAGQTPRTGGTR